MAGSSTGMTATRTFAYAIFAALVVLLGSAFGAPSASASITMSNPAQGSSLKNPAPSFGGVTDDLLDQVTLKIYAGTVVEESALVQTVTTLFPPTGGTWSLEPTAALPDGVYTAQASQTNIFAETTSSEPPVTFSIDTTAPAVSMNAATSPTRDPTPTFSGSAGSATGDIESVTVRIYPGALAAGSPIRTFSVTPHEGTWEGAPGLALEDGTYTAQAEQADEAGNTATSSPSTFTLDTAAPAVSLAPVTSPTNESTPNLSGGAGVAAGDLAEIRVRIYPGESATGSPVRTFSVTPTGATWGGAPGLALGDGTYTAQAEQSDEAGNAATSAPSTFTVDTTPPAVHIATPANGSFVNSPKPTFSGTAGSASGDQTNITVKIYAGSSVSGSPTQEVSVTRTGASWTTGSSGPQLLEGTYTLQAEQSDEAHNTGTSTPSTFTIKTKGPAVSLTTVGSPTNDSTPSFSGSAGVAPGDIASVTLKVYPGTSPTGSPVRTLVDTPSGATWGATPSQPLTDGTYTAQAEQSDEAGDTDTSAPSTFVVDTAKPTVQITSPAFGSFVNSPKPTLSGTAGSASGDQTNITVKIYAGSSVSGSPTQEVSVTRTGGSWTTGSSGPQLAEGSYTLQAEQSDEAHNTGTSTPSTFTIKTNGPAVSLTTVGSPTNDSTPSFGGSAGVATGDNPSVTLKVYKGASPFGSPALTLHATPSGASWAATPSADLGDGTYTAEAEQSDKAGNTTPSAPSTFTIDTVPPSVSLFAGPSERHTSTPQFEGNAGTAPGDVPSVTLNIYSGKGVSGRPVREVQATLSGGKWKAAPSAALGNGPYTAQASQSDEAGNIGKGIASEFTIKSKGPVVTLSPPPRETNDPTPSFSGSAGVAPGDMPSVRLRIYPGTVASGEEPFEVPPISPSGASWTSGPVETLSDGTYTVLAEQSNDLGTTGVSAESIFTVDTAPPAITITSPVSAGLTNTGSQVVAGAAGTNLGDTPTITVRLYAGSAAAAPALETRVVQASGGGWQVAFEGLAPGTYNVQGEQSDEAGNTGQTQPVTFTVTTPQSGAAGAQPPSASFTWLPSAPHVGEVISLFSSSTDSTSPITAFAWDLLGNDLLNTGQSTTSTSFTVPGNHVVRLRVTAADGLSALATGTIPVAPAANALMQPFPIVRITSTDTRSGIRLKLLRVQTSAGSQITVTCRGRGCPVRFLKRLAASAKGGIPAYTFERLQRSLRAGVVLEIRVSKPGEIGKYTRLTVRLRKLPQRVDRCLDPGGVKPIACPP
jgi:large repetitive protein